jgi:hypothetical protein
VCRFGKQKIYILSAGWGLIASDFLTPCYDITFSGTVKRPNAYKRRKKTDSYRDFRMLRETDEELVFFGGKDYHQLFVALTDSVRAKRTVFYNSKDVPQLGDCKVKSFLTRKKTNWHYDCARAFINGQINSDYRGPDVLNSLFAMNLRHKRGSIPVDNREPRVGLVPSAVFLTERRHSFA